MAHTYAFAIGGAVVLSVALTPVLAAWALRVDPRSDQREGHEAPHGHDNRFLRWVDRTYRPLFEFALRRRWAAIAIALAPVAAAAALLAATGTEFMPKLEEGNFWIRATLPTSVSLETSGKHVGRMRRILLGCEDEGCTRRRNPEVRTVVSQLGRPDDGTDPSGFYNIEMFAPLIPQGEWRRGITKEKLTQQLSRDLHDAFPGVDFNFSQAIADNVEEAMSGVKGENTVKVVGPDLKVNEQKAAEIVSALQQVRGVEDLGMFRSLGQPDVKIAPDRERCGRYGLNVGDVAAIVQAAIGGPAGTPGYEGGKKIDLVGRCAEPYRQDARGRRAAAGHHSHHPGADRLPGLLGGRRSARHADRPSVDSGRLQRRGDRALPHRHPSVDLGRHGIRLHLRHRRAGRDHRGHLCAEDVARGSPAGGGRPAGGRARPASGVDDGFRGPHRAPSRGAVPRDRQRDTEAPGDRRHRRDAGPRPPASPAPPTAAHSGALAPRRPSGPRRRPAVVRS